jgi:hypothetical protein
MALIVALLFVGCDSGKEQVTETLDVDAMLAQWDGLDKSYSAEARLSLTNWDSLSEEEKARRLHELLKCFFNPYYAGDLSDGALSWGDQEYLTFDVVPFASLLEQEPGRMTIDPGELSLVKQAAEAGSLDLPQFFKKYGMEYNGVPEFLWELAEEASRPDGRFHGPDMRLTLQLIARGGNMFGYKERAIKDCYTLWKSGASQDFVIENYLDFENMAMNGRGRAEQEWAMKQIGEKERAKSQKEFQNYMAKLPHDVRELLKDEETAFHAYLEEKVSSEEGHGGSGHALMEWSSMYHQEEEHLEIIKKLLDGEMDIPQLPANEPILRKVYADLTAKLEEYHQAPDSYYSLEFDGVFPDGIPQTSVLWFTYRDAMIALLTAARPDIKPENVRRWITEERIENLKYTLQLVNDIMALGDPPDINSEESKKFMQELF